MVWDVWAAEAAKNTKRYSGFSCAYFLFNEWVAHPQRQIIILASLFTYVKLKTIPTIYAVPFPTVTTTIYKMNIFSCTSIFLVVRVCLRNSLPTFHSKNGWFYFLMFVFVCSSCIKTIFCMHIDFSKWPPSTFRMNRRADALKINR